MCNLNKMRESASARTRNGRREDDIFTGSRGPVANSGSKDSGT